MDRLQLFTLMSENLASVRGGEVAGVVCPLCFQEYSRVDLDSKILTIEHCIPRRVGGRLVTLTCRTCNNRQGSKLDSQLTKLLQMLNAFEGIGTLQTTLHSSDGHVEAITLWTDGARDKPITLRVVGDASHPRGIEELINRLKQGPEKLQFTFKLGINPDRLRRGLARAAYLCVTALAGYEYILSPAGAAVRAMLNGDGRTPQIGIVSVFPSASIKSPFVPLPLRIGGCPPVVIIVLRLFLEKERYLGVIFPLEGDVDAESVASVARELIGKTAEASLTVGGICRFRFDHDPISALSKLPQPRP